MNYKIVSDSSSNAFALEGAVVYHYSFCAIELVFVTKKRYLVVYYILIHILICQCIYRIRNNALYSES